MARYELLVRHIKYLHIVYLFPERRRREDDTSTSGVANKVRASNARRPDRLLHYRIYCCYSIASEKASNGFLIVWNQDPGGFALLDPNSINSLSV
jgi:hypothetical protein